ncbi:trypco2 family protein [Streptomyces gamaensis]|uniref:Trypco2 family protein n=1 Tax=Streptomyces gamaensis TaxID=1763542 RepID=A0ABW0YPY2_9ACTN
MSIGLSEALNELRKELYEAQASGAGQQLRFELEKAELELAVEFHRDGSGKVNVTVGALGTKVGGEARGALGDIRKQRLTLTLNVRDEATGGQHWPISRSTDGSSPPEERGDASAGKQEAITALIETQVKERPRREWEWES